MRLWRVRSGKHIAYGVQIAFGWQERGPIVYVMQGEHWNDPPGRLPMFGYDLWRSEVSITPMEVDLEAPGEHREALERCTTEEWRRLTLEGERRRKLGV